MKPKQIIPAITGIRAVAAGMVFFYHWFFQYVESMPLLIRAPFEVGYVGVPVFFALSGFLITVRYADDLESGKVRYGRYLWKRFVRIYPLYFFILTFLVFAFGRPVQVVPTDARGILVSYTMTQALFPSLLLIATTTGWTLTIEMMFYLAAPPLLRRLKRDGPVPIAAGRALIFGAAGISLGLVIPRIPLAQFLPDTFFGAEDLFMMHYTLFGHLPDFLVGMVAGVLYSRRDEFPWIQQYADWLIWLSVAAGYGVVVWLAWTDGVVAYGAPLNRLLGFGTALFSASLILGLAGDGRRRNPVSRLLGSRLMVYLGATSYALYLVQLTEPLQWLYWVFLGEMAGVDGRILRAVLLYGFAVILSAFLYELVERPCQRWLSRWQAPQFPRRNRLPG